MKLNILLSITLNVEDLFYFCIQNRKCTTNIIVFSLIYLVFISLCKYKFKDLLVPNTEVTCMC